MHNKKRVTLATLIIPYVVKSSDVVDCIEEGSAYRNRTGTSSGGVLDEVVCIAQSTTEVSNSSTIFVEVVSGKSNVLAANVENNSSIASDRRINKTNTDGLDVSKGYARGRVTCSDKEVSVNVKLFAGEHSRRTCSHNKYLKILKT